MFVSHPSAPLAGRPSLRTGAEPPVRGASGYRVHRPRDRISHTVPNRSIAVRVIGLVDQLGIDVDVW